MPQRAHAMPCAAAGAPPPPSNAFGRAGFQSSGYLSTGRGCMSSVFFVDRPLGPTVSGPGVTVVQRRDTKFISVPTKSSPPPPPQRAHLSQAFPTYPPTRDEKTLSQTIVANGWCGVLEECTSELLSIDLQGLNAPHPSSPACTRCGEGAQPVDLRAEAIWVSQSQHHALGLCFPVKGNCTDLPPLLFLAQHSTPIFIAALCI